MNEESYNELQHLIITPDQLIDHQQELKEILTMFKTELLKKSKGSYYYEVSIPVWINDEFCGKVKNIYLEAGYKEVICTQINNYTHLILKI